MRLQLFKRVNKCLAAFGVAVVSLDGMPPQPMLAFGLEMEHSCVFPALRGEPNRFELASGLRDRCNTLVAAMYGDGDDAPRPWVIRRTAALVGVYAMRIAQGFGELLPPPYTPPKVGEHRD